ncbi:hypothetical protein [Streptomyces sp. NBC_01429]|uniref:hypothetical protein n=1 Tax=Streptomyces sp. NBC_01429 TaxID=2903862 RepID=UPI002E2DC0AD|nr:hypothetical protein [Streptomyces sp. NBC_01429]
MNRPGIGTLLRVALALTLTGCGMNSPKPEGTRAVDDVKSAAEKTSSRILDIIAVKGAVSEPGPGVTTCEGADPGRLFTVYHPWSITGSSDEELGKAMRRLKSELPGEGWEIVQYGPNSSRDKTLELTADHAEKKLGLNVELWEQSEGEDGKPKLIVNVISACYQAPDGEEVDYS